MTARFPAFASLGLLAALAFDLPDAQASRWRSVNQEAGGGAPSSRIVADPSLQPQWRRSAGSPGPAGAARSTVPSAPAAPAPAAPAAADSPVVVARPAPRRPQQLAVRSLSRAVTVNGNPYPDVALKLPNAFAQDEQYRFSGTLSGTSRLRACSTKGDKTWEDCADGELFLEFTPFRGRDASFGVNWMIQSLSNRGGVGTAQGAAQSLGFKAAYNLTPTTGLAIGGEHILQLDSSTDLGRNFYVLLSQAVPLGGGERPPLMVATVGAGTDSFGYAGNGIFGSMDCGSGNNISSRNSPSGRDCFWGPVGSISIAFNDRISLGAEWFGFGIGAGVALRPFRDVPLSLSVYAMDFLGNTPGYIENLCTDNPCATRFYGRMTYSF